MKLRIRGNSVRLRLTKSEVARLTESGLTEDTVEFGFQPAQNFIYALEAAASENVSAALENNRLCIFVPKIQTEKWANSDQISIEAEQSIGSDKVLRILIEKDFACLEDREKEDDSDAFPHPENGKSC